jgi:regulator of protease activity HflC (stomatin/prohibitin superfamily)
MGVSIRSSSEQLENSGITPKLIAKVVGSAILVIIALSLIFSSFYSVDQGEKAVQTRFGSVVRVADPGLNFKLPWIDDVTRISVRTNWIDFAPPGTDKTDHRMEAYSHDQQPAMMSVKVAYHVKADEASIRQLYSQFRNSSGVAEAVLIPRSAQAIKTTFGQFTAVSVVQNRNKFNELAAKAVEDLVAQGADGKPVPIVIDGVQIYDISFSPAYIHAVEERMKAEVEVAKVTQNLERTRKEAEMEVVQAEASAKAVKLEGEARAYSIKVQADALRENKDLVQLKIAEKWDGKLPTTMVPGSAVPFMSVK